MSPLERNLDSRVIGATARRSRKLVSRSIERRSRASHAGPLAWDLAFGVFRRAIARGRAASRHRQCVRSRPRACGGRVSCHIGQPSKVAGLFRPPGLPEFFKQRRLLFRELFALAAALRFQQFAQQAPVLVLSALPCWSCSHRSTTIFCNTSTSFGSLLGSMGGTCLQNNRDPLRFQAKSDKDQNVLCVCAPIPLAPRSVAQVDAAQQRSEFFHADLKTPGARLSAGNRVGTRFQTFRPDGKPIWSSSSLRSMPPFNRSFDFSLSAKSSSAPSETWEKVVLVAHSL